MFFNQQEMKKGSCQDAQNAECGTLRSGVSPCVDIWQPD